MTKPEDPPAATAPHRRGFDALAIVLGILVSLGMFAGARHQEDRLSFERLRRAANEHYRAAVGELREQLLVSESARTVWGTTEHIGRLEFASVVPPLMALNHQLRSVEWVPVVSGAERNGFERKVREDAPGFRIHELGAGGRPVPAAARETYYPVLFLQARPLDDGWIGFDRGSEPAQLEAFARAVSTGQHQASGPHRLGPDGERRVFRTALPVFQRPGVPVAAAERLRTLRGFVVCSFDAGFVLDLARDRFGGLPVHIQITDEARGVAIQSFPGAEAATLEPALPHTLDLGGVKWTLSYRRLAGQPHALSWLLLGFGLLLTGLLALNLRSGQERAAKLARSNRELTLQIQERHAAEARSREAQRALTTLFSNLPGMAYRCVNEPSWAMEFVSDGCLPLTGYHPAELQSGNVSFGQDVIHEGDRQRVWHMVQHNVERHEPFELVYRIVTKGGDTRWVWEQGRGVFDDAGELEVLEGFVTDITAQKSAEQGLRKEKHFSDTAIDSLPGVFYLFDSNGRYLRWNQNLERVTGYGHDEIAELHPLQLIAPEDRDDVGARIAEVFETGVSTAEANVLTKGGERVPYFFTGRRITMDDQLCLLGMGVDVTDRQRAEEERRSIQRKVLETQKLESIGLLAGGIAHDFNNLLTTVVGNLKFARDRMPKLSPAQEFVDLAGQAADRAGDLTQQLLAYTGRANFERQPIDLSERIHEIAHLLATSISKKVNLQLKLGERLPAVEADATQIQQVAMNLVLNGAEACGEHSGVVQVRTEARTIEEGQVRDPSGELLPAGRYVSLVVEDTGCGMDEATVQKIFDPFYTTKFTGRGLGLAAVLGIVRGHGGALEVRSSPGRGSSFEVLLPASSRRSVSIEAGPPRDLSGRGRILVADDEPSVLRVVRQTLRDCGYEVLEARDGREAVELFRRRGSEIDMVLLDMTMPEMNGAEALAAIHGMRPEVPALLSSGYDEEEATRDVLGAGLAGFIQKPYTPEELAAKVKEVLAGGRERPSAS